MIYIYAYLSAARLSAGHVRGSLLNYDKFLYCSNLTHTIHIHAMSSVVAGEVTPVSLKSTEMSLDNLSASSFFLGGKSHSPFFSNNPPAFRRIKILFTMLLSALTDQASGLAMDGNFLILPVTSFVNVLLVQGELSKLSWCWA